MEADRLGPDRIAAAGAVCQKGGTQWWLLGAGYPRDGARCADPQPARGDGGKGVSRHVTHRLCIRTASRIYREGMVCAVESVLSRQQKPCCRFNRDLKQSRSRDVGRRF